MESTTVTKTVSHKRSGDRSSRTRPRSSSQSDKGSRLLSQIGSVVGELMGKNIQGGSLSNPSQMMDIALGLLHSYNTRTDARGGLTDQILNTLESFFINGINSDDFAQKAEKAVKVLLTAFALKSMRGSKPEDGPDSTNRKIARAAKAMAMGILAKKVIDDLLNKKPASDVRAGKTEQMKNLLFTILEKQALRGESQANSLDSTSKSGAMLLAAKALVSDLQTKRSVNGLADEGTSSKQKYVDTIKMFAEHMIRGESTNAMLISKAAKYGIDSRLALQAKELIMDFDKDKAKVFASNVAGTYLDKASSRPLN